MDARLLGALRASLAGFGGHLLCKECGRISPLGAPASWIAGGGWPQCCGYTMQWMTAAELAKGGGRG